MAGGNYGEGVAYFPEHVEVQEPDEDGQRALDGSASYEIRKEKAI